MPAEDLGYGAAELLSLMPAGEARSLNKLADLAVSQVPGCSGASASIWSDGELLALTATHPDVAELVDLQLEVGAGPVVDAVRERRTIDCPDLLTESRWPRYTAQALGRGVRCSVHLVRDIPPLTLVISLFGVRAGALAADSEPMARMVAEFAQAVLTRTLAYGETRRTASQLQDAMAARAVVDQAKGILMHALGCDADRALDYLRSQSQRRHVKVTEIATQVVAGSAPRPGIDRADPGSQIP